MSIVVDEKLQAQIIEGIEGSPRGASAFFIKVSDQWGLKLYYDEDERDIAFANQTKCFAVDWAPEVGEKFDLPEGVSTRTFGYFTELVECVPNGEDKHLKPRYHEIRREFAAYLGDAWVDENCYIVRAVNEIAEKTGWYFGDSHIFNWGRKNGKYIPIDFG